MQQFIWTHGQLVNRSQVNNLKVKNTFIPKFCEEFFLLILVKLVGIQKNHEGDLLWFADVYIRGTDRAGLAQKPERTHPVRAQPGPSRVPNCHKIAIGPDLRGFVIFFYKPPRYHWPIK